MCSPLVMRREHLSARSDAGLQVSNLLAIGDVLAICDDEGILVGDVIITVDLGVK